MRRACIAVVATLGCASSSSTPASKPPPQTPPVVQRPAMPPEPEPAPKSEPAEAETAPAQAKKPTEPEFEPLRLSDEQLVRARRIQPIVKRVSAQYDVEPNLINGMIWAESKFNPRARNRSGARGLMQLMPKTSRAMAQRIGQPNRPYDPKFAVTAGVHLLRGLMDKFDGSEELALFGYARGSGSVRKWQSNGDNEIPQGVQKFIARVRRAQATFDELGFPDAG